MEFSFIVEIPNNLFKYYTTFKGWNWLKENNYSIYNDYDVISTYSSLIFRFKTKEIAIAFALANL